jgi:hypothetical protein
LEQAEKAIMPGNLVLNPLEKGPETLFFTGREEIGTLIPMPPSAGSSSGHSMSTVNRQYNHNS